MMMHPAVNQDLHCSAGKSYLNACWLRCSVTSDSLQPNGLQPARLLSPLFQARILEQGATPSTPRDLLDPGTEPASLMSPALAGGFFETASTS